MKEKDRKIEVVGVQMDFGAASRGVNMGSAAIRFAGLMNGLRAEGYTVEDRGDIVALLEGKTRTDMRHYEQVIDVNRRLYGKVGNILSRGNFPLILGGDHSIAAGSISAVSKYYEDKGGIGIIWIDAHGDFNDEKSTESGNMHGMPFSAVCGYGPRAMVDYGQKPAFVEPRHCVQIAGRDFDAQERKRMREAGVRVFPINEIDKRGMDAVIQEAIAIAGEGTCGIHLSFDIDALTPEVAPGTGTPVHSGITTREAFFAAEEIAASHKLISMDMVEVNPILDERNKTAILASELIQSALGKIVY